MKTTYKKYSLILFISAICLASVSAKADERSAQASQTVVLGDLDLGSTAGQRSADVRVRHAVENVCPDRFVRDLRRQMRGRACQGEARSGGAAQRSA